MSARGTKTIALQAGLEVARLTTDELWKVFNTTSRWHWVTRWRRKWLWRMAVAAQFGWLDALEKQKSENLGVGAGK